MISIMYSEAKKKIPTSRIILFILLGLIVFIIGFFVFIIITDFKPEDRTVVEMTSADKVIDKTEGLTITTLNMGYGGLDDNQDFFMDGGKGVNPSSEEKVRENIAACDELAGLFESDFVFIQEIDKNSSRTYHIDETELMMKSYVTRCYAQNHVCKWIPYPLPMIGKVDSGIMTFANYKSTGAERISLPNPYSWPKEMFMFDRCLLVNRFPIAGSDKELVLINLHFDAYSNNSSKTKQMKALMKFAKEEYAKGNYVVAGGDFNMSFPKAEKKLKQIEGSKIWRPGTMTDDMIPKNWKFCYSKDTPTCRSLDKPYTDDEGHQLYIIDGYIISPNVSCDYLFTVDGNFRHTDHNPVYMKFSLKQE